MEIMEFLWSETTVCSLYCVHCAGAGVQDLTLAGVSVFQQDRSTVYTSKTRSGYFWLKQDWEQQWFLSTLVLRS